MGTRSDATGTKRVAQVLRESSELTFFIVHQTKIKIKEILLLTHAIPKHFVRSSKIMAHQTRSV